MKGSFSAAFLALGLASGAFAGGDDALSWERALVVAAENNPGLAAARRAVESAQASRAARWGAFLPSISADAGVSRSGGDAGSDDSSSAGLSARQSLFSGLRDKAALDRAQAALDGVLAALDEARARAGFDVSTSFIGVVLAQEQSDLAAAVAERRKQNARLVELRYEAGRENRGSFLRSRAAHSQALFEKESAERALRVARRRLSAALGAPPSVVLRTTGTFSVPVPGAAPDMDSLVLRTPSYRAAEARLRGAEAASLSARSRFSPDLSATGSLGRSGDVWPPTRDRWSAGVSLSIPLFSGGTDFQEWKAARADADAAREDLRADAQATALSLEESFSGYQDAVDRARIQEEFLEAARVRSEISRAQYSSGLLSFQDWDLIENDLISQQNQRLSARRAAATAWAAWERDQGRSPLP